MPFVSSWADRHGVHTVAMDKSEVDILCGYCPDTHECRSVAWCHRCASLGRAHRMPKKKTLIAGLVALAGSKRGRKMIADARTKYDTPENRRKAGDAISQLRKKRAA